MKKWLLLAALVLAAVCLSPALWGDYRLASISVACAVGGALFGAIASEIGKRR